MNIGARSLRRVSKATGTIAMRSFSDTFKRLLTICGGKLTEMNLINSWPQKKCPNQVPMGFLIISTGVLEGWVLSSCFMFINVCLRVALFPHTLLRVGPSSFSPNSSDVDNNGLIVRSPDALRPLTLSNCDCKILTTAISRGLQWYTMRCIHPSQRCISSRQMTDNIFEVETTVLAHVACCPQESGILLTDFAASPSVNHSWIIHALEWAELPEFSCRFLRMIHCNSTTHVEFAGRARGQFTMARVFRQGCPASGFLFAIAFDPIFCWLENTIIPRNPPSPDFLQPAPCAEADDFAVAASSFRLLMTALPPAFEVVDESAGLNLNHRKCC